MERQHTINKPVSFSGVGLHTGAISHITIAPAPENTGIVFRNVAMAENNQIKAVADYVVQTSRGTVISNGTLTISTLEHLMATMSSLGIDNALIDIDCSEVPIMDGSAREFANTLSQIGLKEQNAERKQLVIDEPFVYEDKESGSKIEILPSDEFAVDLTIDFASQILGRQSVIYTNEVDFVKEIAPCRTFVFLHEILFLYQHNLIKGGSLDNAIVIAEKPLQDGELAILKDIFNFADIKVERGYLNNLKLRFDNECARHKMMDLLGDFSLVGMPIKGKIVAYKPGHGINTTVAKLIRQRYMK